MEAKLTKRSGSGYETILGFSLAHSFIYLAVEESGGAKCIKSKESSPQNKDNASHIFVTG